MQKILITCEHGGRDIPAEYASYFSDHEALLATHRGYDIGALKLYEKLVSAGADAAFFSETSRLLVELNRSKRHPNLFSIATKNLPREKQNAILEYHYVPYRQAVEEAISGFIEKDHSVLHLSVHSFTPVLNGVLRNADIGLLYDPKRKRENEFCARWKKLLSEANPNLKVRFNYPYRGTADGFTTHLRRMFPDEQYAGIELEVNQKFPLEEAEVWENVQETIVKTFQKAR
ncbi:N-formylglutamate amidohydrolase [Adhaeribacter soli]|uniref:N-formylglutamate amidohydrolase n=1 Tax=Adhaeribacter soli TaxID=2607655 RepID=A0A5N1IHW0_9BACT|nr:N-formylglutamate amidohydrolase [Adhaeribacter soli]KAA9325222.1 N-formylglutamate amidohydrolase [Adhaeribacter soli]